MFGVSGLGVSYRWCGKTNRRKKVTLRHGRRICATAHVPEEELLAKTKRPVSGKYDSESYLFFTLGGLAITAMTDALHQSLFKCASDQINVTGLEVGSMEPMCGFADSRQGCLRDWEKMDNIWPSFVSLSG